MNVGLELHTHYAETACKTRQWLFKESLFPNRFKKEKMSGSNFFWNGKSMKKGRKWKT
jgi:hypothetical protein